MRRLRALPVLLLLILFASLAHARPWMGAGSSHDFVQYGYTGGGVCDECHNAGGTLDSANTARLYRWATGTSGWDSSLCYLQCHDATPAWPATPEYAAVPANYGGQPPKSPHPFPCGPQRCDTSCHGGTNNYAACLVCHAGTRLSDPPLCESSGVNYDNGYALNIGNFLTLASKHDVVYNTAGNLLTPADNECLKCHGVSAATDHPGGNDETPLFVYPDDPDEGGPLAAQNAVAWTYDPDGGGPLVVGSPIYRWTTNASGYPAPDYQLLQNFCFTCHDGLPQANAATQIGGKNVPPVPRRDPNRADPKISQPPYFATSMAPPANFVTGNYFEKNGHGRSHSMEVTNTDPPNMNLTCLAQSPEGLTNTSWGCHSVHGSTSSYLIQDSDIANVSQLRLGTGVTTVDALATQVCMGCHPRDRLNGTEAGSQDGGTYTTHGPYKKNFFHTWLKESTSDDKITHVSYAPDHKDTKGHGHLYRYWDGSTGAWWPRNMEISNTNLMQSNMALPFFSSENAPLDPPDADTRLYGASNLILGNTRTSGSVVACVTCHDPHGTAYTHHSVPDDPDNTRAMIRLSWTDMSYDDLFCGVCHVNPGQ